jgi:hypothetical protein
MFLLRIRGASPLVDCLRGYSPVTRPSDSSKEYPRQCIHVFGVRSINLARAGFGPPALTMMDTGDSSLKGRCEKRIESPTNFQSVQLRKDSQSTIFAVTGDVSILPTLNLFQWARTRFVGLAQAHYVAFKPNASGDTPTLQKTRISTSMDIVDAALAGESTERMPECVIQVWSPSLRHTRCANEGHLPLVAQCNEGCSCSLLVSTCLMGARYTKSTYGPKPRKVRSTRRRSTRLCVSSILETGRNAAHSSLRRQHTTSYTEARSVKPRRDRKSVQSGADKIVAVWLEASPTGIKTRVGNLLNQHQMHFKGPPEEEGFYAQ